MYVWCTWPWVWLRTFRIWCCVTINMVVRYILLLYNLMLQILWLLEGSSRCFQNQQFPTVHMHLKKIYLEIMLFIQLCPLLDQDNIWDKCCSRFCKILNFSTISHISGQNGSWLSHLTWRILCPRGSTVIKFDQDHQMLSFVKLEQSWVCTINYWWKF